MVVDLLLELSNFSSIILTVKVRAMTLRSRIRVIVILCALRCSKRQGMIKNLVLVVCKLAFIASLTRAHHIHHLVAIWLSALLHRWAWDGIVSKFSIRIKDFSSDFCWRVSLPALVFPAAVLSSVHIAPILT